MSTPFKKALVPTALMLGMDLAGWIQGSHFLALLGVTVAGIFLIMVARQSRTDA